MENAGLSLYRACALASMFGDMKTTNHSTLGFALATPLLVALAAGCGSDADGGAMTTALPINVTESGAGRNVLVLHGGGGPATMTGLVTHLARTSHVILPTHPGWNGTPRPDTLHTVAGLADEYVRYLNDHDLNDVLIVGNSMGGWLGAEIALRDTRHRITGLVIIDGLGVDIPGQPITNITGFTPQQIAAVAYYDPANFNAGAPPPTPEQIAVMRANQATLAVFAGDPYGYDPTLLARLAGVAIPALLLWGDSDRIVDPDYGRAYAAAIPNAQFEIIEKAGHLPWLENAAGTFGALDSFVTATSTRH